MVTDFLTRFSGIRYSDPNKQLDDEVTRQRNNVRWQYEQDRLARADAAGRRDEEYDRQQESVFAQARKDLDAGGDNAAVHAANYVNDMSEIVSLVSMDRLEEANQKVQLMRKHVERDAPIYRMYAATRPKDDFEKTLNAAGNMMWNGAFWGQKVQTANGTDTTVGALFRDGDTFKSFQRNRLVAAKFTTGFADAYASADSDEKRQILSTIADPVLKYKYTPDNPYNKYISQYRAIGDYVVRNYDALNGKLRHDGLQSLVLYAVNEGVKDLTAMETIKNAVSYVDRRMAANPSVSPDQLVMDFLGKRQRVESIIGNGQPITEQGSRLVSKVMTCINEGVANGGPVLDTDDPFVRDHISTLADTVQKARDRGIPLLELGKGNGVDMRRALYGYLANPDDGSNYITRVNNALGTAQRLFLNGATPTKDGGTYGNMMVDGVTGALVNALSRDVVGRMGSSKREDVALGEALSDDAVVGRFADALAGSTGWTGETSTYVAGVLRKDMSRGGGVSPVDLNGMLVRAAASAPEKVKRELLHWYSGARMALPYLSERGYTSQYVSMLTDPVLGNPKMSKESLTAALSQLSSEANRIMARGVRPDEAVKTKIFTTMAYRKTGNWIIPGYREPVTGADYKAIMAGKDEGRVNGKLREALGERYGEAVVNAIPEVRLTDSPVDIRKLPDWKGLDFDDPAVLNMFLRKQGELKASYDALKRQDQMNYSRANKDVLSRDDEL